MSDFYGGKAFIAGSLTGIRSFSVDRLGRLNGPSFGGIFTPGENLAQCSGNDYDKNHKIANEHCACGFYAYHDTKNNPHHRDRNVQALIEGYGTVTTGNRGFRAEKAKLKALILPTPTRYHPVLLAPLLALIFSITWGTLLLTHVLPPAASILFVLPGGVLVGFGFFCFIDVPTLIKPKATTTQFDLLKRNYPDVPIYPSVRRALRSHPLTPPLPDPIPEPSDPDFWKISA